MLRSALKKLPKKEKRPGALSKTSANLVRRPIRRGRRVRIRRAASSFAFASLLLCTTAFGAQEDARRSFELGRTAFQQQDYAGALEAFEAALAAGLSGPAIHFNIGVAAYRLEDYARAERAFAEAGREPSMAALAYYNLGLVEQRRARLPRAAEWFTRAANETEDERVRELAIAQLERAPEPDDRDWAAYASASIGYDDNVALVSSSDVLGVSGLEDTFAEGQLAFSAPLSTPLRFDGGLFVTDYTELDRFDQLGLYAGVRYRFSRDTWKNQVSFQLARSMLDGEGFENRAVAAFQSQRSLHAHWNARARYRFSYIDGLNEFSGVGGHRHEASVRLAHSAVNWDLGMSYEIERSELDDPTLSATRHELRMDMERALLAQLTFEGDATLQWTRYAQGDDEETRTELGLALARSFGDWRIVARYSRADNDADIPEFDYGRNKIAFFVEVFL